jgi:hypothetical protein
MSVRTTSAAVKLILGNHYDSANNPSLDPFIESASVMIDQVVTCATAKGVTLTTAQLEIIERWLSAHFYALSDPIESERITGKAASKFQGATGTGFNFTAYGQMAVRMDSSGCLSEMNSTQQATVLWLGTTES